MSSRTADTTRLERYDSNTREFTLAIITDEDHASQIELDDGQIAWQSTLRYDRLYRHVDPQSGRVHYELKELDPHGTEAGEHQLISLIAEGGRGAEFSELVMYNNRLITMDDRTGLLCEIRQHNRLVPRQILMTGSGDEKFKGFKSEWATLKGGQLVIGSHGRHREHQWIKVLGPEYSVQSIDWADHYQAMCAALDLGPDGYLIHEAAEWQPYRREWLFFPRKVSREAFDRDKDDAERGGNTLIVANEDFSDIRPLKVGEHRPERGISSFKLLPGFPNECVGLKSIEIGDRTESFLFCFNLDGEVLQDDVFIGNYKCEGVEIL